MPEKTAGVNRPADAAPQPEQLDGRTTAVIVYTTFPSLAEAERIGGALVEMHLAACVNLLPGMRSIYRWQGNIEQGEEVVGIVKTRAALAERVVGALRVLHPYGNPAATVLPITGGSAVFLAWIADETAAAGGKQA